MQWGVQLLYVPREGNPSHVAEPCEETSEPARQRADRFLITNNRELAEETFSGLQHISIEELWQLAFPASAAENLTQMQRECDAPEDAEGFLAVWRRIAEHLSCLPLWALETVELTLREAETRPLDAFFGLAARRIRKSGKNCGEWMRSFDEKMTRHEKRVIPTHADCSPVNAVELTHIIGANGVFANIIPGYEPREGQAQMVEAVARTFNEEKHLIVEAGTGVGKSLGYLLPAAKWALFNDTPVIISTHMKNLQAQLMEKDIPMLLAALAQNNEPNIENFRVALIKGRSNYLCLRKLGILLDGGAFMFDRPGLRQLARAVMWSVQTTDGDLDAFSGGVGAEAGFLRELSSIGEECSGRKCRQFRRCFLRKARERAGQAHLVLANHALVFMDRESEVALPAARQIIFDEAHNLEDVATRYFSVEVTVGRFLQLLSRLSRDRGKMATGILETLHRQLEKGVTGGGEAIRKAMTKTLRMIKASLGEVRGCGDAFFTELGRALHHANDARRVRTGAVTDEPVMPLPLTATLDERVAEVLALPQEISKGAAFIEWEREDREPVARAAFKLVEQLVHCAAQLNELANLVRESMEDELTLLGDQAEDLDGVSAQLKTFALDIQFALQARDASFVYWIQHARLRETFGEMLCAPLSVGERLAEEVYANVSSIVFCSATLRTGGNFHFMARRLGLDLIPQERLITCLATSPFDYANQCRVFVTKFLPEPAGERQTEGGYVEALAAMMRDVFLCTHGRGLGLFTSYEMLQGVVRIVRKPLEAAGIRVLVQDKGYSRDQITRIFRAGAQGGCVLLGTHSFWEGVDVVGEALSCVVIARLPFAALNDPITSARAERIEAQGGNAFREFSVPSAVIRFRQGFGRLIRSRNDRGVVIVADPRIETKFYGRWFKQALPCASQPVENPGDLLREIRDFV